MARFCAIPVRIMYIPSLLAELGDEQKHVLFLSHHFFFCDYLPVLLTSAAAILLATALQVETYPALVAMVRAVCPSSVFARSCVVSCAFWNGVTNERRRARGEKLANRQQSVTSVVYTREAQRGLQASQVRMVEQRVS